jgi:hypothetical protein
MNRGSHVRKSGLEVSCPCVIAEQSLTHSDQLLAGEHNDMKWIDEMFASIEKDREPVPAKRAGSIKVDRAEGLKKQSPGALGAWNALLGSITSDVNEFNKHKKRAGQTAACISQGRFQCQVYLPGMNSKRLVLSLDNNGLAVSVHPEFPKQQSTINIELDKEGQHGWWVLDKLTKENAKLSAQELSEYLLKPILASAETSRDI